MLKIFYKSLIPFGLIYKSSSNVPLCMQLNIRDVGYSSETLLTASIISGAKMLISIVDLYSFLGSLICNCQWLILLIYNSFYINFCLALGKPQHDVINNLVKLFAGMVADHLGDNHVQQGVVELAKVGVIRHGGVAPAFGDQLNATV